MLIADNERLAARGLRLMTPQLQDVEVKQLKSGASREKVSYADNEQCTEYLVKRVADAGSEGEVLEIVGDAMVASLLADENELPQSKQVRGGLRVSRRGREAARRRHQIGAAAAPAPQGQQLAECRGRVHRFGPFPGGSPEWAVDWSRPGRLADLPRPGFARTSPGLLWLGHDQSTATAQQSDA